MDDLEHHALGFLLAGDHSALAVLREQAEAASVAERSFSGVGFFTRLHVPAEAPRLAHPGRFVLGDVYGDIASLEYGAGFLLFVSAGALDTLEGFSHEEVWPDCPMLRRLYYVRPREGTSGELIETQERDLAFALRHLLQG